MLSIKNINKAFNRGTDLEHSIFEDFNLDIEENLCTAIIGSNGSGKSTLMNIIAGSVNPDKGSILIDDEDISRLSESKRSKYLGRVFQDPSKGVSPSLTILENMALADNKGGKFSLDRLVDKDKLDYYKKLLAGLGLDLENHLYTKVSLLSGGQRQSLSLLMASMKKPRLLLLDEHTASLDPKTSRLIMEKTRELIKREKITTIMITHNMKDAISYADRVVMLKEGKISFDHMVDEISQEDLESLYRIAD
ncbi:ABC transporter ATP-binding protein [Peptoniphilaceae bacterium SGI.131]